MRFSASDQSNGRVLRSAAMRLRSREYFIIKEGEGALQEEGGRTRLEAS